MQKIHLQRHYSRKNNHEPIFAELSQISKSQRNKNQRDGQDTTAELKETNKYGWHSRIETSELRNFIALDCTHYSKLAIATYLPVLSVASWTST